MRRSKIVSPLHFVWATYRRMPLITAGVEGPLHSCLQAEAQALGGSVLAVGGMPDHVHIAILFPATLAYSQFAKQLKGVASSACGRRTPS
jgi:Transposase and inactivated derivatives